MYWHRAWHTVGVGFKSRFVRSKPQRCCSLESSRKNPVHCFLSFLAGISPQSTEQPWRMPLDPPRRALFSRGLGLWVCGKLKDHIMLLYVVGHLIRTKASERRRGRATLDRGQGHTQHLLRASAVRTP